MALITVLDVSPSKKDGYEVTVRAGAVTVTVHIDPSWTDREALSQIKKAFEQVRINVQMENKIRTLLEGKDI